MRFRSERSACHAFESERGGHLNSATDKIALRRDARSHLLRNLAFMALNAATQLPSKGESFDHQRLALHHMSRI